MLSYRHAFHAGNHADILKHLTLILTLSSLNKKGKPYSVFDTHAGAGLYDLNDESSLKTGEAKQGIKELFTQLEEYRQQADIPDALNTYIDFCRPYIEKGFYPGSPQFERCNAAEGSQITLCELHNNEYEILKENMFRNSKKFITERDSRNDVHIHHRDGLEALMSMTPPQLKRGLAIIDPSYEESGEYDQVRKTVCHVHKKWNVGIIMIWYPLLAHRKIQIESMKDGITSWVKSINGNTELLDAQFLVNTEDSHIETSLKENAGPPRLYGSGVIMINPSWKLNEQLETALASIKDFIYRNNPVSFSVSML